MALEIRPQSAPIAGQVGLGDFFRFARPLHVPKSSAAEPIKDNAAKANVQAHRPTITPTASVPGVIWSEFQSRFRQNLGLDCPHRRQMPIVLTTAEEHSERRTRN
jgi:hypothetical protein